MENDLAGAVFAMGSLFASQCTTPVASFILFFLSKALWELRLALWEIISRLGNYKSLRMRGGGNVALASGTTSRRMGVFFLRRGHGALWESI